LRRQAACGFAIVPPRFVAVVRRLLHESHPNNIERKFRKEIQDPMHDLEQSILQLVTAPGYRPAKPRVIARQLNLPQDDAVKV
jgi:hypothetical protein